MSVTWQTSKETALQIAEAEKKGERLDKFLPKCPLCDVRKRSLKLSLTNEYCLAILYISLSINDSTAFLCLVREIHLMPIIVNLHVPGCGLSQ